MQTIDEAREHCRFVGKGIEKMVADGEDLTAKFEGTQLIRFKVDRPLRRRGARRKRFGLGPMVG